MTHATGSPMDHRTPPAATDRRSIRRRPVVAGAVVNTVVSSTGGFLDFVLGQCLVPNAFNPLAGARPVSGTTGPAGGAPPKDIRPYPLPSECRTMGVTDEE